MDQLRRIYAKKNIRHKQAKKAVVLSEQREGELIIERVAFANKLTELKAANRSIIYADESTFQTQAKPMKTWMGD